MYAEMHSCELWREVPARRRRPRSPPPPPPPAPHPRPPTRTLLCSPRDSTWQRRMPLSLARGCTVLNHPAPPTPTLTLLCSTGQHGNAACPCPPTALEHRRPHGCITTHPAPPPVPLLCCLCDRKASLPAHILSKPLGSGSWAHGLSWQLSTGQE